MVPAHPLPPVAALFESYRAWGVVKLPKTAIRGAFVRGSGANVALATQLGDPPHQEGLVSKSNAALPRQLALKRQSPAGKAARAL